MAKVQVKAPHQLQTHIGSKPITLNEPIRTFPVTLNIREVANTIPAGLQMDWGEVNVDGDRLQASVGAGLGSGWGVLTFRGKRYVWAVSDLVEGFLNHVLDAS